MSEEQQPLVKITPYSTDQMLGRTTTRGRKKYPPFSAHSERMAARGYVFGGMTSTIIDNEPMVCVAWVLADEADTGKEESHDNVAEIHEVSEGQQQTEHGAG